MFTFFIVACTAERFFRVDRAQEHLHYVVDICNDDLYILDAIDDGREEGVSNCMLGESEGRLAVAARRASEMSATLGEDNNNTIVLMKSHASRDEQKLSASSSGVRLCVDSDHENGNDKASRDINVIVQAKTDAPPLPFRDLSRSLDEDSQVERDDDEKVASNEQSRDFEFLEAAKSGNLETLKRLHESGSSLTTAEANGMTALHYAARCGYEHIVQFLLKESHALMELRNDEGQTALHEAAKSRRQRICGMLAVAGCSLGKTDNQGMTAKELALNAGDEHLSAYLDRKCFTYLKTFSLDIFYINYFLFHYRFRALSEHIKRKGNNTLTSS